MTEVRYDNPHAANEGRKKKVCRHVETVESRGIDRCFEEMLKQYSHKHPVHRV